MTEIIHCADLHLSTREPTYSLSVLDEIIRLTRTHKAAYLLFAGDTFDSFPDAEALRGEFRTRIGALTPGCEILLLPGNHEDLRRGRRSLRSLDLGPVTLLDKKPFRFLRRSNMEFLAVPHQPGSPEYRDWQVPAKKQRRIVLAHGVVSGLAYGGLDPDGEGGGSALDPDLFVRFRADYAALGHIHARRQERQGGLLLAYPGSARVWRRGESGERGLLRLSVPDSMQAGCRLHFHALKSAGQYREIAVLLGFDGESEDLAPRAESWQSADTVRLVFSGLVEDEHVAADLAAAIERRWSPRVRKLEIEREQVAALPGIASHPLAKRFLAAWTEREPHDDTERRIWLRARQLGLQAIKETLEARR
jgi:DNA repair exonuclease SbcCD nuclease subunit